MITFIILWVGGILIGIGIGMLLSKVFKTNQRDKVIERGKRKAEKI